jgi:hypothetical protein
MRRLIPAVLVLVVPTAVQAQEPAPSPQVTVVYDKGFTLLSPDQRFELKTGLRGQIRSETTRKEAADELQSAFLIPRLRLQLEGFAYGAENAFKIEFDMANKGSALLKDYYYDHAFSEALHVRAGQWKRPFSRHEIVSDFGSAFLERSEANKKLADAGRDLGLALHNNYEKSPEGVEWALGVFNGASEKGTLKCKKPEDPSTCTFSNVPDDFGPTIVARVGWNQGGIKGYSEGDLEGGPLRLAVGASYRVDLVDLAKDMAGDRTLNHYFEADVLAKAYGLDVLGTVFLVDKAGEDRERGWLGQLGYFVLPKELQVAARYGQRPDGSETEHEILGAFSWYFHGHSFKWMLDGGVLRHGGADDIQIRTQLQFVL